MELSATVAFPEQTQFETVSALPLRESVTVPTCPGCVPALCLFNYLQVIDERQILRFYSSNYLTVFDFGFIIRSF